MEAAAPGYGAYRDPTPDRSTGGSQSMNNVVMWRKDRWNLIDGGRVKVVDNDTGILLGSRSSGIATPPGRLLQRKDDGAIVSVVSAHMPTNPESSRRSPAGPRCLASSGTAGAWTCWSTRQVLAQHGPVLVGGDMNSHHSQGAWSAAAR